MAQKERKRDRGLNRIAILNSDRCKPHQCQQECKKFCPVVHMGKMCIEVTVEDKMAKLSEKLCIGCGICVKKCPFQAITIINLPASLDNETTHRYSENSFKLHRLPIPKSGVVLGLVGANGTGKSTALKILSGNMKPNLGRFDSAPEWSEILTFFRGSELQNYFKKMSDGKLKAVIKPQYVDQIARTIKGSVQDLLENKNERNALETISQQLDLQKLKNRNVCDLSGGELQRFCCAIVCIQESDVYMFDEPSSYLDIKQRLKASKAIRELAKTDKYTVVVEHDLAVLDYLSDYICCLYGIPGAYGVVTLPSSVREGINIFLDGFIPAANLRFREYSLTFKIGERDFNEDGDGLVKHNYQDMTKTLGDFKLEIGGGDFTDSQIVVMLGENGTGKTTFIQILAGKLNPDSKDCQLPPLSVSYKPQKISPKFRGSVQQLLHLRIQSVYTDPQFVSDVIRPLKIADIMNKEVLNLSGGELQRLALTLCLGKSADIYLIDEPSAYLDSEQRLITAKMIKRFIMHSKKTAFVVEHDFIMATYLADRVIVFDGAPGVSTKASAPLPLVFGMNKFLEQLQVTIRRDKQNFRPRINKMNSQRDSEQKRSGNFFFNED